MTLNEAAKKWDLSPNWVRTLVKTKRVPAELKEDGPVPYYDIPDDTPKPPSMQRAPRRKGTGPLIQKASVKRRAYREEAGPPKKVVKRAPKKAAPKK